MPSEPKRESPLAFSTFSCRGVHWRGSEWEIRLRSRSRTKTSTEFPFVSWAFLTSSHVCTAIPITAQIDDGKIHFSHWPITLLDSASFGDLFTALEGQGHTVCPLDYLILDNRSVLTTSDYPLYLVTCFYIHVDGRCYDVHVKGSGAQSRFPLLMVVQCRGGNIGRYKTSSL